jgi:hypothetical protein
MERSVCFQDNMNIILTWTRGAYKRLSVDSATILWQSRIPQPGVSYVGTCACQGILEVVACSCYCWECGCLERNLVKLIHEMEAGKLLWVEFEKGWERQARFDVEDVVELMILVSGQYLVVNSGYMIIEELVWWRGEGVRLDAKGACSKCILFSERHVHCLSLFSPQLYTHVVRGWQFPWWSAKFIRRHIFWLPGIGYVTVRQFVLHCLSLFQFPILDK